MGRISDVLDELSKLGAVGGTKKQEASKGVAPAPVRVPAREEPAEEAPEADEDVEATIAALSEGFRDEDDVPESFPAEEAASDEPDEAAEAESEAEDDNSDLIVLAHQKLEEIEEATDQLRRLLRQMQER